MIKEHHQHIKLHHPDILPMAKHRRDLAHSVQFQDTKILAMKTGCMECIIKGKKD
jgi:hypothetical protein